MQPLDITTEVRTLGDLAPRLQRTAFGVGVLGMAAAAVLAAVGPGWGRLLDTYLVSFCFYLTLSLGALFFVLLQHVTRAGWSVVVRRVAEAFAANLDVLALLAIPVVLGMHHLYHWSHAEVIAADPMLARKASYLNPTFFTIRLAIYFAVWIYLGRFFFSRSVAQDSSGDPGLSISMERFSGPAMVLFAFTVNFAGFDLLMSLDPHWFSTIFGVYFYAGAVVAIMAALPIAMVWLQGRGRLEHAVSPEHYHDLGKLLFAFIVFWAYIAFSQYMLIWYGNLPEETEWFLRRQTGAWTTVSLILLFGHFFIPFIVLLPRTLKRRPVLLAAAGAYMLVMHWVDLYWLAMPELSPDRVPFGPVDVLCFVGLGGLWVGAVAWRLRRCALVPERDPRLDESLAFENI